MSKDSEPVVTVTMETVIDMLQRQPETVRRLPLSSLKWSRRGGLEFQVASFKMRPAAPFAGPDLETDGGRASATAAAPVPTFLRGANK